MKTNFNMPHVLRSTYRRSFPYLLITSGKGSALQWFTNHDGSFWGSSPDPRGMTFASNATKLGRRGLTTTPSSSHITPHSQTIGIIFVTFSNISLTSRRCAQDAQRRCEEVAG